MLMCVRVLVPMCMRMQKRRARARGMLLVLSMHMVLVCALPVLMLPTVARLLRAMLRVRMLRIMPHSVEVIDHK